MQQMIVCHSLLFCSTAEIPIMHPTHIVYSVFVLQQQKGMVFEWWGRDGRLSLAYNEIIFSDKQIRGFWVVREAAGSVTKAHTLEVVCCACSKARTAL